MRAILLILAFCAAPARADIIDGGNLIIGGQGIIQGTMTVQGSGFSVGSSTLAVKEGQVGVGTATPSSKLHVVDGDLRFSTTTGSRGIIFQDGTTQTSATSATVASTRTVIPANSTAINTSNLGPAVANSTITLVTTSSSRHQLLVSAPVRISDGSGSAIHCGFLRNGAFFDGQALDRGVLATNAFTAGQVYLWSQTWTTTETLSAGTYNYAITCGIAAGSGNVMFCQNQNSALDGVCFFEARELR